MTINIRQITKSRFSTSISKFIELAIELNNRWQLLVTVSHHQTANKLTFKMPKGRTLTEEEKTKSLTFMVLMEFNVIAIIYARNKKCSLKGHLVEGPL